MLRKAISLMLTAALMAAAVSCNKDTEDTTEKTTEETATETTEETSEETTETPQTSSSALLLDPSEPWCQAYLDAIPDLFADPSYLDVLTYTLIYLDDDDIPEVFIEGDCEAAGEIVLTYHDGEVNSLYLPRIGTQYIPESGLLYTCTGHMDYYPVTVTSLSDGQFEVVAEGEFYMPEEAYEALADDPDAEWDYTYEWEGVEVTAEEFDEHIAEYYDMEQSVYPNNYYSYVEFQTLLTTGTWESADHRYELIVSDCTWDEARQDCIDRGGYLVYISCNAEAQVIADLINDEGMQDYIFYTGYICTTRIDGEYYSAGFYYPDMSTLTPERSWYSYDYSYYNRPDFSWDNIPFSDVVHEVGVLIYYPDNNFIYIYDAPGDLTQDPSYSGQIAYICEYDS